MPDTDLARSPEGRLGGRPGPRPACPVSARLGPIGEVLEYLPERGEPREWRTLATGAAIDVAHGVVTPVIGEGRGVHRDQAWERCVHEFAERLTLREPPVPDGPPPGGGCPLAGRTIPALDLADGTLVDSPMADYYLHPKGCPRTRTTTSNGAATAEAFWPAVERGLLELLERDA
jgi:hypothetical protein